MSPKSSQDDMDDRAAGVAVADSDVVRTPSGPAQVGQRTPPLDQQGPPGRASSVRTGHDHDHGGSSNDNRDIPPIIHENGLERLINVCRTTLEKALSHKPTRVAALDGARTLFERVVQLIMEVVDSETLNAEVYQMAVSQCRGAKLQNLFQIFIDIEGWNTEQKSKLKQVLRIFEDIHDNVSI
eukprot:jgi/Botrbrau1/5654/Bobra.55_1s0042.1